MQSAISAHLFLYHDLLRDDVIETIARYGFSRIELWAMQPHIPYRDEKRIAQIGEYMKKHGVESVSAHLPLYERIYQPGEPRDSLSPSDPDESRRKRWIEEASLAAKASQALGAEILTFHSDLTSDSESRKKAFHKTMPEMLDAL